MSILVFITNWFILNPGAGRNGSAARPRQSGMLISLKVAFTWVARFPFKFHGRDQALPNWM
jgi:hypothetical protein